MNGMKVFLSLGLQSCESVQEPLGFSTFQLVFGHSVRGPLKFSNGSWLHDETLLGYVSQFRTRMTEASDLAPEKFRSTKKNENIDTIEKQLSEVLTLVTKC